MEHAFCVPPTESKGTEHMALLHAEIFFGSCRFVRDFIPPTTPRWQKKKKVPRKSFLGEKTSHSSFNQRPQHDKARPSPSLQTTNSSTKGGGICAFNCRPLENWLWKAKVSYIALVVLTVRCVTVLPRDRYRTYDSTSRTFVRLNGCIFRRRASSTSQSPQAQARPYHTMTKKQVNIPAPLLPLP